MGCVSEKQRKHLDRLNANQKKENNRFWKGGRRKTSGGYILILNPEHPFCDNRGYVMEHRLVMEKYLGRYLKPTEAVHHINEDRKDNFINNLCLFPTRGRHSAYHTKLRRGG